MKKLFIFLMFAFAAIGFMSMQCHEKVPSKKVVKSAHVTKGNKVEVIYFTDVEAAALTTTGQNDIWIKVKMGVPPACEAAEFICDMGRGGPGYGAGWENTGYDAGQIDETNFYIFKRIPGSGIWTEAEPFWPQECYDILE